MDGFYILLGEIKVVWWDVVELFLWVWWDGGLNRVEGMAVREVVDEFVGNVWWGDIID